MSFTARPPDFSREHLALFHAGLVVVASAWLFGGLGRHGEWIVAALAAPAWLFLALEWHSRRLARDAAGARRLLLWTAPLLTLVGYVIVSALNPSHRIAIIQDTAILRPVPHLEWLPSSAHPSGSLRVLACLGGLAATGLAVLFCVTSRRGLRALLLILALNAVALAVLGTLQRQTGSSGPYFGAFPAANDRWFATFHYYNHWGAFAVLHASAALALVFHSLKKPPARGWFFGPGPLLALAALLLAATAPLSASRSATGLMLVLGLAAAVFAARHSLRAPRRSARTRRLPRLLGLAAALAIATTLILIQSRDTFADRVAQTVGELSGTASPGLDYGRSRLYADTWRMIEDAPVLGWGLESYGRIFLRYSTFRPGSDGLMNTYEDAHSDWLQSLAELGVFGTTLLVLLAAMPLLATVRGRHLEALPAWLLGGCALLVLYAAVEFPFANPAVVATWWVLWAAALRFIQLSPIARSGD